VTKHLLLVTLGPVQDFIAQARRTRDLWYGSHLLSELSRTAARALVNGDAELIFPALKRGDLELAPCPTPLRNDGNPPHSVANKLLAEVPAGIDPQVLARKTREAVMTFWRDDIAARVKRDCAPLLANGIDGVWDEQIDTLVEFLASWGPMDDYATGRRQIEKTVAARKNLRDFVPWQHQRGNVPKSSLDGGRETVLARRRDSILARKYRIGDSEQLDAVGLVKRAGGNPDQFVPITNVALAGWIDCASRNASEPLKTLIGACREIRLAPVNRPALPCARVFPFDASVLLRSRWKPALEAEGVPADPEAWCRRNVVPLLDTLSEPYPYVACLAADGDHIGRAINDALLSPEAHRQFSRSLAEFANDARSIVEDHLGSVVYIGGDDVIAFLPLPRALVCADTLRLAFTSAMNARHGIPEALRPTLSVGIGVGHIMESMGDLLELGREAERIAKRGQGREDGRNALAVIVDKRSGGRRTWRARWDQWECDPVRRLGLDAKLLEQQLSARKVYEVDRIFARFPKTVTPKDDAAWARMFALEIRRSLSRVHAGASTVNPDTVGLALDEAAGYTCLRAEVRAWTNRMIIARTFATAEPKSRRSIQRVSA